MAVITVHSDFGAQENKLCHHFHFFPHLGQSSEVKLHYLVKLIPSP